MVCAYLIILFFWGGGAVSIRGRGCSTRMTPASTASGAEHIWETFGQPALLPSTGGIT